MNNKKFLLALMVICLGAPFSNVSAMIKNARNNSFNNNLSGSPKIYKKAIISKDRMNKSYNNSNNILKEIYIKKTGIQNKIKKNNSYNNFINKANNINKNYKKIYNKTTIQDKTNKNNIYNKI